MSITLWPVEVLYSRQGVTLAVSPVYHRCQTNHSWTMYLVYTCSLSSQEALLTCKVYILIKYTCTLTLICIGNIECLIYSKLSITYFHIHFPKTEKIIKQVTPWKCNSMWSGKTIPYIVFRLSALYGMIGVTILDIFCTCHIREQN